MAEEMFIATRDRAMSEVNIVGLVLVKEPLRFVLRVSVSYI